MRFLYFILCLQLALATACTSEPRQKEATPEPAPTAEPTPPPPAQAAEPVQEPEPQEDSLTTAHYLQRLLEMEKPQVKDYYLALPDGWVFADCTEEAFMTVAQRKKAVKHENPRAGYLVSGTTEENLIVVVYKDKNSGQTYIGCEQGLQCGDYFCGTDGKGFLTLQSNGEWKEVTSDLLARDLMTKWFWENRYTRPYSLIFPEKGTAIEIQSCGFEGDVKGKLGELVWRGSFFITELNEQGKLFLSKYQ
ncbi:MAG: hypothetical protein AAFR61_12225 [Bacteroidota bacterium]